MEAMRRILSWAVALGLGSAVAVGSMAASVPERPPEPSLHLQLDRSAPAADSTVRGPVEELRFWFAQPPRLEPTTIRLVGPDEELIELGELRATVDDASILFTPVSDATPPGVYRVIWRTMATDGHVVRGDFSFTVGVGPLGSD